MDDTGEDGDSEDETPPETGDPLPSPTADQQPWPVEDAAIVFECPWLSVERETVRRPDGETSEYYHLDPGGDAVAIVAEHNGDLVLVSEYRPTLADTILTCPGGRVEEDISIEAAAKRELREETGYSAGTIEVLQSYRPTSTIRYTRHVVYATDLEPGPAEPDDGEFIDRHHVPVADAFEYAREDGAAGWFLTSLLVARADGLL